MKPLYLTFLVFLISSCSLQNSYKERKFLCKSESYEYYLFIDDSSVYFKPTYSKDMEMLVKKNDKDEIIIVGYISRTKASYTLSKKYGTLHDEYLKEIATCRNIEEDGSTTPFKY